MNFIRPQDILRSYGIVSGSIAVLIIGIIFIVAFASIAPKDFPAGSTLIVSKNMSISEVSTLLQKAHLIKSRNIFKIYAVLIGNGGIKAGEYLFEDSISSLRIAIRTTSGDYGREYAKITIPEGSDSKNIAKIIKKSFTNFDETSFVAKAKKYEGYLFPDTYFFYEHQSVDEIIKILTETFDKKISSLDSDIKKSGKTTADIIKMASILEREANNSKDRKIIAGILWKRMKEEMPLQVDASFWYILGKTSSQITQEDLAMNSPYNLYKNRGLPPTPISNPGLESIRDALYPTQSNYYFYLSDAKGVMHYANDLDGHIANRRRYLQ